jgi:capsular exopolysaccharide synthesis family protein
MPDEQRPYPDNLPPEVAFRQLPARQPHNSRAVVYPEIDLPRYAEAEDFHLRWLWRILRKRRWLIIGIASIITTLATIGVFRTKDVYEATTTIEIGRDNGTRLNSTGVFIVDEDYLTVTMNTSEVILKSTPLLEDVVVQLHLDQNPAFLAPQKKSVWESLNDIAGKIQRDDASVPPTVFTATTVKSKIEGKRSPEEAERLAPYVGILEGSLRVRPIVDTRAMTIAFTHNDPVIAASVANAVAQRFVETSFDQKIEKFTSASEWLDRSTRELKSKIERSEQALADYTKSNNIYSIDGKATLVAEKLTRLHDLATRAETDRILKESLYEQVRQGRVAQIPEAFADTQTAELQRKLGELATTAAELSVTFGPKYPKMAEINQQMAAIRDQIAASRGQLEEKLKADYERVVRDENALKAALEEAKAGAAQENQRAIQYSILKQDVDTAKSLYTEFLQKTNQAYLEVAQQHGNIRVISPARVPKGPIGPNRQRTILMGLLLSLSVGTGLAWLLERFDDSIRNADDVNRYTQLPALAVIPAIGTNNSLLHGRRRKESPPELLAARSGEKPTAKMQRARLMEFDGRSPASEAYRALRTGLLLSAAGNPPKTILVTSVRMEEGKTTTATNTAISLAQLGASVLLVDCDLRKPSLHDVFGTARTSGLSTYLARNVDIDEVTQDLPGENLRMIPSGPIPPNPAELLSSERMKRLLAQLGERYDHIVLDTPPLGSVTDAVILSTMVDGVILVVHGGRNSRQAVQRACHELSAVGARIFGIVLNNVDLRREGHDDYYYYSYQYSYSADGKRAKT